VHSLNQLLSDRLAPAFAELAGAPVDPAIRVSERADFQADGALALGRRLGRSPRQLAMDIAERAQLADLCSKVEPSGPGFINLTIADGVLERLLTEMATDGHLGVELPNRPETVVVDYSAPNAAKEMHVGHLRSTILGDAAVRLLEWVGHRVVRHNHLGDWGTPFGMLIEHLLDIGEAEAAHALGVGDLDGFYRAARQQFDADPHFRERARQRVVLLQSGESTTRRLWQLLVEESKRYFVSVYEQLGVRLTADDFVGESTYQDQLHAVLEELDALGLLHESEGARVVLPRGFTNRDNQPLGLILQKSDGGFGYAVTDLAALRSRVRDLGATRILYVVGRPQRQHLEMVFEVAREAGWLTPASRAEHVGFGAVLGSDGKMLRTRAGTSLKLVDLLDEAVARATDLVATKNPSLAPEARAAIGRAVGIGAVKYADLSTERTHDYVFDWQRMLAFDGNTAPYVQYAQARSCSVLERAPTHDSAGPFSFTLSEPPERALALDLLRFPAVCAELPTRLEFHQLAGYLYALATSFTRFYEQCRVLQAEGERRQSRLALCHLSAQVLRQGLSLLGIDAPQHM
jgi:arginyl-tRNA synthetase